MSTIPRISPSEKLKALQNNSDLLDVIKDIDSGEINELAVVAEGEEKTSWFVWTLVTCAAVSGLLFGALSLRVLSAKISHSRRLRYWCYLWCIGDHRYGSRWLCSHQRSEGRLDIVPEV